MAQILNGNRIVFAYSMAGLFLGYVYFSIPRVVLTVMASAEKLDPQLEEAVAVVMAELKENPVAHPKRPPYPNYHAKQKASSAAGNP